MTGPTQIRVAGLFISSGHDFLGHSKEPPGEHPLFEGAEFHCVAGRGVAGARFLDFRENYEGLTTFCAAEVVEDVCRQPAATEALLSSRADTSYAGFGNRAPGPAHLPCTI